MDIQSSEESSAESDEEADNDDDEIVDVLPSMGKFCYADRSLSPVIVQQKNYQ